MKLSDDQKNRIGGILNFIKVPIKCPVCGSTKLALQPDVYYFMSFNQDEAFPQETKVVETALLICDNCRYIMHFAVGERNPNS